MKKKMYGKNSEFEFENGNGNKIILREKKEL